MRVKVVHGILIYNGGIYQEGDYVEVENEGERQRMIQNHSVVDSPNPKPNVISRSSPKPKRVKGGKRNGNYNKL